MLRALLLALALIPISAVGASAASVTIAPSGGGAARSLSLADLASSFDVHGATYTVRAADGSTSTTAVADGISLNALLAAAGLDSDAFDYIALSKADGSIAIVMRDDLGGTEQGPPVVWSDEHGTHFLRPSGGNGDQNGADRVDLADGAPLLLALKRGEPLVPRIVVSPKHPRPGERVDFSASLAGGVSPGPGLGYQWYLDGPRLYGADVSYRFPKPGTYHIVLNVVRGDRSSLGDPATIDLRVARSRERHTDKAHPAGARNGPGTGVGGGGGGGVGAAAAPAAPSVSGPTNAAVPSLTPAPERVPAAPRTPPGKFVSGTLLASASAAAAPVSAGRAASAAVHRATADGPLHVPVGVWVAVGLVALVALGWALESRHTLPFWQP